MTQAQNIAAAIEANCHAYTEQRIDRATWDAEQHRLWKLAADACCASVVVRLVAPSLGGAR